MSYRGLALTLPKNGMRSECWRSGAYNRLRLFSIPFYLA